MTFCLPTATPVNSQSLNYTVVAVGIIAVGAMGTWVVTARKWFVGPLREIELERAGIDVSDPAEVERAEKAGEVPGVTGGAEKVST